MMTEHEVRVLVDLLVGLGYDVDLAGVEDWLAGLDLWEYVWLLWDLDEELARRTSGCEMST